MKTTIQMRRLLRPALDDRGSTLVEFAITAWMLVLCVFGVIGFALAMYTYHFVSYGAQMGARYASVHGADFTTACSSSAPPSFTMKYSCEASTSDVQNYVQSLATGGVNPSTVVVTTTYLTTNPDGTTCTAESQGCLVKVNVTYSFPFLSLPFLPSSKLSMVSTAEQVIQE